MFFRKCTYIQLSKMDSATKVLAPKALWSFGSIESIKSIDRLYQLINRINWITDLIDPIDPIVRIDPIDPISWIDPIGWIGRIDPKLHKPPMQCEVSDQLDQFDQLVNWIN